MEFVADQAGTFDFTCSEYCGTGHAAMKGRLVVLARGNNYLLPPFLRCPLARRLDSGSEVPLNLSMRVLATGLCVVAVSAVTAVVWWRSANVGPVQRGANLAVAQGCLGCHGGPGVSPLLPRPFADLDDVDPATLREWILDGMPRRVRQDPESREALEAAAIRMPAWRERLTHAQVDDLVAYVRALAAADVPEDPTARKGHAVAERLGCFRCHGPGGRGAGSNPGSLKGYIPPWDGARFRGARRGRGRAEGVDPRWASATASGEPVGSLLPRSPSDSDAGLPRPSHGGGVAGARGLHWLAAGAGARFRKELSPRGPPRESFDERSPEV